MSTAAGLQLPMPRPLDLLARAALAPRAEAASAWRDWRAAYDIDTTPWSEVRMLGAVAARIDDLEPDAAIRPRVHGIRKFLWVKSQICLKAALGGVAALNRAGIPVLLMKGAARIALDPASAQERLIRDLDALVPLGRAQSAYEALQEAGWSLVPDAWQLDLRQWSPIAGHHAWSLAKDGSEFDLHHFSNHLNRLRGDDDGLWSRARPRRWQGVDVCLPAPADALLIALVHGVRWSEESAADWTVDASALIDGGAVDWSVFLQEAEIRLLQAPLLAALLYLRHALHKVIPDQVVNGLQAGLDPLHGEELEQYVSSPSPATGQQIATASRMATRRALARSGQTIQVADASLHSQVRQLSVKHHPAGKLGTFELPEDDGTGGWLIVKAVIDRPASGADLRLKAEFRAPGLALASVVLAEPMPSGSGPHEPPFLRVAIPAVLLQLRGIRELGFCYEMDGAHAEWPVTITISRAPGGSTTKTS